METIMNHHPQPGREVRLRSGAIGVLFSRTSPIRKRFDPDAVPTWYFLPDSAAAVGLVVMGQPCEISEGTIAEIRGLRPGRWPSPTHRLSSSERQAVYVAHMKRAPLPELS